MKKGFEKLLALLIVSAMTISMLVGCGGQKETSQKVQKEDQGKKDEQKQNGETTSDKKPYEGVTVSLSMDSNSSLDGLNAVLELAKEKLGITVEVELRPGGAEGENIVKTRLASGEMTDIVPYNSGAIFMALNPSEYFYDISKEDFVKTYVDSYKKTVTVDDVVYGVPIFPSEVGAVLYYKPDYEELGLKVPKTWDEFMANCAALKKAGKTAVIGSFGEQWTTQVCYLGDHYNVVAENPNFEADFEAGKAKYATTPAGLRSFQKLADLQQYYNEGYSATTYSDGCEMLANGQGTHWIMLTGGVLDNINSLYPDKINDIGVFAIPGDDPDNSGLTVWMPASFYINKKTEHLDAILDLMRLYVSKEGLDTFTGAQRPNGPYCIKGYALPDDACDAVKIDMQSYFESGKTTPALEFMTAVKGPNCPAICQEVGSGQSTPEEAAAAYDEDCKKQALQLGLNWE